MTIHLKVNYFDHTFFEFERNLSSLNTHQVDGYTWHSFGSIEPGFVGEID